MVRELQPQLSADLERSHQQYAAGDKHQDNGDLKRQHADQASGSFAAPSVARKAAAKPKYSSQVMKRGRTFEGSNVP